MDLQTFFPYRVARLAEAVSQATAQVYVQRFGLSRDEWRVLAALADHGRIKTARILEITTLDKMRVSRAIARLERDGLISREADPDDGRGYLVQLTAAGKSLHGKIVPMVQAREAFLLEVLDPRERQSLDRALTKVQERAEKLLQQG